MMPLAILYGVVFIMACLQKSIVGPSIPNDPQLPLPTKTSDPDQFSTDGSIIGPGVIGAGDIGDANPPAYVDPQNPIPDRTTDPGYLLSGPIDANGNPIGDAYFVSDPWSMEPVFVPANPDLPVKIDPVAKIPPVYFDPDLPVPSDEEKRAAGDVIDQQLGELGPPVTPVDQPTDFSIPVPTADSDPQVFVSPEDIDVPPAEDPMNNWTAETTDDTECDPNVEVEFTGFN